MKALQAPPGGKAFLDKIDSHLTVSEWKPPLSGIIKRQNERIRITDIEGKVFVGNAIEITDVEDDSPGYGFGEDSITIEKGVRFRFLKENVINFV
jgi:hypothetical protein